MKIGSHEGPKQAYSCSEYIKPRCSINQGQTEEELNEEAEDAASDSKCGRMWGDDTAHYAVCVMRRSRECDDSAKLLLITLLYYSVLII